MASAEARLMGGRTTAAVVRVGDTVRRPPNARSHFVHELLRHLGEQDFLGAPRFLGLDEKGREVLTFIPGEVPAELGLFSESQVSAAAKLLRSLHDATTDCELRGDSEVVCHGDPSPCNCAFVDGVPRGFIDFDAAHPGARGEDLGYAAWLWLDMGNDEHAPEHQGRRLASFTSAYDSSADWPHVDLLAQAMSALSAKPGGPPGRRDWALSCLAWTRRNRQRILAGAGRGGRHS